MQWLPHSGKFVNKANTTTRQGSFAHYVMHGLMKGPSKKLRNANKNLNVTIFPWYLVLVFISCSFKVLVLTYQALHRTAPQYMIDLLSRYQPTRSLRSSDALLLTAPQSRLTSCGDRAFQHAAPRLWNWLPISRRSANNLNSFKNALKTFLFKDAYNV